MPFVAKDFGTKLFELDGISKKTCEEHLKLYNGYINKTIEFKEFCAEVLGNEGHGRNPL